MATRLVIITLLLLYFVNNSSAQKLNTTVLQSSNFCDTIPFEYANGKIIMNATIADRSARFILDTGAPFLLSDNLKNELKLNSTDLMDVTDVTGKSKQLAIVDVPQIAIGNIRFSDSRAIAYEKGMTGLMDCFNVEGLIGSTILKDCIVHIDTKQEIIILTDRIENTPVKNTTPIKMKLDENSRPFINLRVGKKSVIESLFDSGSDKLLPLSYTTFRRLEKEKEATVLNKGYGSISAGLFGSGKKGKEYRVAMETLQITNAIKIENVIATASEYKNKDAIGMGISQYGTVTIDYPGRKFYLNLYPAPPVKENKSFLGFHAQLSDGDFIISAVYDDSPASRAGVHIGQKISQINNIKINSLADICGVYLSGVVYEESIILTVIGQDGASKTLTLTGD